MNFERMIFERINAKAIEKKQYLPTIKMLLRYSIRAQMKGLLALEDTISEMKDPFLAIGIQFIVDGTDPDLVQEILQRKMIVSNESPERIFECCMLLTGILSIQRGDFLDTFLGIMQSYVELTLELEEEFLQIPEKDIEKVFEYTPTEISTKFCKIIESMDDRAIQTLLRKIDWRHIMIILLNVSPDVIKIILQNLSPRVGQGIKQNFPDIRNLKYCDKSQKEIVTVIFKLMKTGEIFVPKANEYFPLENAQ